MKSAPTKSTQIARNSPGRRLVPSVLVTPLRSVGQDNPATPTARLASVQPALPKKDMRAQEKSTAPPRTQKGNVHKRQTVQLTSWVHPRVKAELQRIAASEGISVSRTTAAALEEWIAQHLHIQHAGILQPIIEQAIAKHMRSYSTRIAVLLVRSLFASEQTRSIVTNILGRQQGVTQNVLEQILDGSSTSAKRNITRVTPQLATLIREVEQWIQQGEK